MNIDPDHTGKRWSARRVPPELERAYVEGGWWTHDTLGAMVARQLAAHPASTIAIWSRSRAWQGSYADIDDEARRLVTLLQELGVQPGDAVAFQLPNWREAVVSFAALALGGYIVVPIVHIYGRKEVAFILEQSGAVAYISPLAYGHIDYAEIVETAAPASLRLHVVVGDAEVPPGRAGLVRIGWAACADRKPAVRLPTVRAADVAVLAYTSGTTSDPKGVIHDHRTLLSELRHMQIWFSRERSNLMGSPVTHATGMLGVLAPLTTGGSVHLIDRWDPTHALEVMLEAGIGGGTGASVFLASLLDHPDFTPRHAALMSRVGLGGAPVSIALGERAASHGIAIIRAYGSTEHPSTTGCRFDDPVDRRHRTDGRALPGVELRLVDDDGADVPAGTPGEILSRGPDLCLGYTDPALTAAAFDDEGWYHSGDIGVLDEQGFLTITDRVKDIIIRGGENISAAEVEEALQKLPGVAEIAVVAAPDARLGEHACAIIRMRPGAAPVTLADVKLHLSGAGLARQKWPEELRLVDEFPRTASGKIRKIDLRARLRSESGDPTRVTPTWSRNAMSVLERDFFNDPEIIQDPDPYYAALRELGPVVREPHHGVFLVSGIEEILAVCADLDSFSSVVAPLGPFVPLPKPAEGESLADVVAHRRAEIPLSDMLMTLDPPRHGRHRALLSKLFTPNRLEENEEFMWTLADRLIDEFADCGEVEFCGAYAGPFTLLVIADLLGVPREHHETFRSWLGKTVAGDTEGKGSGDQVFANLFPYFMRYIEERRAAPGDDAMTQMANARFPDGEIPEVMDVVRIAAILFAAGQETTARLLSTGMRILAEQPSLADELRADPAAIPNFVEECLRFESPIKGPFRLALRDTRLAGVDIPMGSVLMLMNGAANRDPRVFEDGDRFDAKRRNARRNIAFGHGEHFCPGASLARAEARISFERLLARLDGLQLVDPSALSYAPSFIIRGLNDLPLRFRRRA